eukprot:311703-Amorphochlora_amoeboformis.AAC.1
MIHSVSVQGPLTLWGFGAVWDITADRVDGGGVRLGLGLGFELGTGLDLEVGVPFEVVVWFGLGFGLGLVLALGCTVFMSGWLEEDMDL